MIVAPKHEHVMFTNRDKFDLIVMYDLNSTSFGPDSPLEILTRAIHEREFKKILRNIPVMLLGGLNAWKEEFGDEEITQGDAGGSNFASPVISPTPKLPPLPSNGVMMPTSPRIPNGVTPTNPFANLSREPRSPARQSANNQEVRTSTLANSHHASFSLDQPSHHSRYASVHLFFGLYTHDLL